MGFFKHSADPFKEGVKTTGTIERVHDTGRFYASHGSYTQRQEMEMTQVYLVFRLDNGTVIEKDFLLGGVPRPGRGAQVAYLPDDMAGTLEFDIHKPRRS